MEENDVESLVKYVKKYMLSASKPIQTPQPSVVRIKEDAKGNEIHYISSQPQEQVQGAMLADKSPAYTLNYLVLLLAICSLLIFGVFLVMFRRKKSRGRYTRLDKE